MAYSGFFMIELRVSCAYVLLLVFIYNKTNTMSWANLNKDEHIIKQV